MNNPITYMANEDYIKSNAVYNRSGLANPIIYIDESWREVHDYIPSVRNGIFVSNLGDVYDENTNSKKSHRDSTNGYQMVSLPDDNNKYENFLIHRLVGEAFIDNPNPEKYDIINHKDGIKLHSYEENLEWTDFSGNLQHAYDNNLRKVGEKHMWAKFTEAQVRIICECLEKRMRFDDICSILGIEYNDATRSSITLIRKGQNWKSISSQYNIPTAKRNTSFFTDDQIHEICKMLEQKKDNYEILKGLGIDVKKFTSCERANVFEIISRIRRKERFTRISENYNF